MRQKGGGPRAHALLDRFLNAQPAPCPTKIATSQHPQRREACVEEGVDGGALGVCRRHWAVQCGREPIHDKAEHRDHRHGVVLRAAAQPRQGVWPTSHHGQAAGGQRTRRDVRGREVEAGTRIEAAARRVVARLVVALERLEQLQRQTQRGTRGESSGPYLVRRRGGRGARLECENAAAVQE